ncbi:MAG: hypothetical protein ACXACF_11680 [Candidatus Hermodarchaeia archaeon]
MVSDTDLAKGELRQPEMEVEQTRRRAAQPAKEDAQPKRSMTSSIKSVNLKLLLMVIVILGIAVYYIWTADLISPILESLPINNKDVVVTSIVYSEENASAMVSDRIVYETESFTKEI